MIDCHWLQGKKWYSLNLWFVSCNGAAYRADDETNLEELFDSIAQLMGDADFVCTSNKFAVECALYGSKVREYHQIRNSLRNILNVALRYGRVPSVEGNKITKDRKWTVLSLKGRWYFKVTLCTFKQWLISKYECIMKFLLLSYEYLHVFIFRYMMFNPANTRL